MATTHVTVRIIPDPEAFIRNGYSPAQETVDIDLSTMPDEDRAVLADAVSRTQAGGYEVRDPYTGMRLTVAAPTAEAIIQALREARANQARRQAEEAARQEAEIQSALAAPLDDWVYVGPTGPQMRECPVGCYVASRYRGDPRLVARREEARRHALPVAMARWQAEQEARKAAQAERERKRQEALSALRAWAVAYGSERVRLLIEEQHPAWREIAEDEYLAAHTPEGYAPLEGSYSVRERTKPTAQDIRALRQAREICAASGGVLRDAAMAWIVRYRPATEEEREAGLADEDGDVVADRYAAIEVTVATPTGTIRQVYRRVGRVE